MVFGCYTACAWVLPETTPKLVVAELAKKYSKNKPRQAVYQETKKIVKNNLLQKLKTGNWAQ